ncbi:MAG: hypothetical protein GY820_15890 [Gammaproteobacteria bacterium]|nr:hypothetical protein [Gammaproteobacteria bacterium]
MSVDDGVEIDEEYLGWFSKWFRPAYFVQVNLTGLNDATGGGGVTLWRFSTLGIRKK